MGGESAGSGSSQQESTVLLTNHLLEKLLEKVTDGFCSAG